MLVEAISRTEAAAKETLAAFNAGGASCEELRKMLAASRRIAAVITTLQTAASSAIATTERHGDGGTGVLAETTGLTRREARGQVKTAETISAVPSVREAVAQGRVSSANAKRLADAVKRTSATAVEADGGLLRAAESMRAEQFTKEARRWIAEQQNDGGEADYQRMRAERCVRVWNNDNGMVELHGTFDPLTGQRIGNRLRTEANRLYQHDKKHAGAHSDDEQSNSRPVGSREAPDSAASGAHSDHEQSSSRQGHVSSNGRSGGSGSGHLDRKRGGDGRRTFDQCMADALDNLTSNTTSHTSTAPTSNTGTSTNRSIDIGTDATTVTHTGVGTNTGSRTGKNARRDAGASTGTGTGANAAKGTDTHASMNTDTGSGGCRSCGTGVGRSFADICVIVQVDAATGELVAQLPDGERLPASVLDKLTCNARISVILANSRGQPIWRTFASRTATDTQRRLLLARWGGCFHCGAHSAMCQIHHIVPVAQGGETKIDNMIPVCWDCHDLIHDYHWQIHKRSDGHHTLHPPQQRHHGPAHAPEQPLMFTHSDHEHHNPDPSPPQNSAHEPSTLHFEQLLATCARGPSPPQNSAYELSTRSLHLRLKHKAVNERDYVSPKRKDVAKGQRDKVPGVK